ncbi:hypothetical protein GPX89_07650 [Nocardia sp. ET3-3]|uniref:Uncharacterized protein n=1 Tax=Nocardia terrae TaxID=2675851 RepID=A0A7K1US66_9NOCA|nr:hypothetical protein [Nocardia terrae]MVU77121.1 hypothetical protein [Nocardia terrae]
MLDGKRQRALTISRQAAQTLATLIDDLEHHRIPSELQFGDEFTDLEDLLREAEEFQSEAIALELINPPDQPQPGGPDTPPAP